MTDQEIQILDMQDIALRKLTDKERKVIELRFGLINGEFLTYKKVARKCGISIVRVQQVVHKSIRKIRHYMSLEFSKVVREGAK